MNIKALLKIAVGYAARVSYLRGGLTMIYVWWNHDAHVNRLHPFDRMLGINTGGSLPAYLLQSGKAADSHITAYCGVVPSVLRTVLATVPDASDRSFIDLGAGKGRALAVASEFPFRAILGIELNPDLCRVAARNAAIVRIRYPDRTRIEVQEGDASRPLLPDGPLVVMFYHSFRATLVRRLVDNLATAAATREILFIYVNPVYGAIIDNHKSFSRWFAEQILLAPDEIDYSSDTTEAVVIWRTGPPSHLASTPRTESNANRVIIVEKPEWRAELV